MGDYSSNGSEGRTLADLIEDRYGEPAPAGHDMPAEGTLARILTRRTHRRYAEREVPEDLLQVLFAAAFSASAKSDLMQSAVVRVSNPEKRRAIAELIPSMPWVGKAPVFMVWCGDNRRIRRISEMRGKPFANDHLDSFLNAATDTALAMQTFVLAAEDQGLGCCPISAVRNVASDVARILDLPEWVFPWAGLCLGWPAQEGWISMRLPLDLFVHDDAYDDTDLAARVDAYDRNRDARYSVPAEKQRDRERWGTADFYGWSEDKARQVAVSERDDFGAFVRRQGFRLD